MYSVSTSHIISSKNNKNTHEILQRVDYSNQNGKLKGSKEFLELKNNKIINAKNKPLTKKELQKMSIYFSSDSQKNLKKSPKKILKKK